MTILIGSKAVMANQTDGNGYGIYGAYINKEDLSPMGLFGTVSKATISNLNVIDCYFTGTNCIGGIAGISKKTLFYNCYSRCLLQGDGHWAALLELMTEELSVTVVMKEILQQLLMEQVELLAFHMERHLIFQLGLYNIVTIQAILQEFPELAGLLERRHILVTAITQEQLHFTAAVRAELRAH